MTLEREYHSSNPSDLTDTIDVRGEDDILTTATPILQDLKPHLWDCPETLRLSADDRTNPADILGAHGVTIPEGIHRPLRILIDTSRLRNTLFKYRIHHDHELVDQARGHIKQSH